MDKASTRAARKREQAEMKKDKIGNGNWTHPPEKVSILEYILFL